MPYLPPDIVPLTEETKVDYINWLGDTLDFLEGDRDNRNYNTNRVFGTLKDDRDEAYTILSVIFATLQNNTLVTKASLILLICIGFCSCQNPTPVYYQAPPTVVTQPVQQQAPLPYEIYNNGGQQVVYYHDPNSGAAYFLEYALFMSMWNSPNRYYSINHYYVGHRSYIDSRNSYYRNSYRPSAPTGGNRPSSSTGNRPSAPTSNRPSAPASVRPSSPTSSSPSRPSYTPRASAPSRSSYSPSRSSGGRH
jgi:hypothetical protein